MPWAVAWYADRKSLWLPHHGEGFPRPERLRPARRAGSSASTSRRSRATRPFISEIVKGEYKEWAQFIMRNVSSRDFPLKYVTALPHRKRMRLLQRPRPLDESRGLKLRMNADRGRACHATFIIHHSVILIQLHPSMPKAPAEPNSPPTLKPRSRGSRNSWRKWSAANLPLQDLHHALRGRGRTRKSLRRPAQGSREADRNHHPQCRRKAGVSRI